MRWNGSIERAPIPRAMTSFRVRRGAWPLAAGLLLAACGGGGGSSGVTGGGGGGGSPVFDAFPPVSVSLGGGLSQPIDLSSFVTGTTLDPLTLVYGVVSNPMATVEATISGGHFLVLESDGSTLESGSITVGVRDAEGANWDDTGAILASVVPPAPPGSLFDHPYPRLLLYTQSRDNPTEAANLPGDVHVYSDPHAADLARWDVLALDANYVYWYPTLLADIKAANPSCRIVMTFESAWTYQNWGSAIESYNDIPFHRGVVDDPRFTTSWLVVNASGQPLLYYHTESFPEPGADIFWTDPTDFCPPGPTGLNYREFLVARLAEELVAHPEYDGVMWDAVRHYGTGGMDLNRDGTTDTSAERTAWWTAGFSQAMAEVNAAFPTKVALYQSGQAAMEINPAEYIAALNGDISPEFPMPFWIDQGGAGEMLRFWRKTMRYQMDWMEQGRQPTMGWVSGGKNWYVIPPANSDHYRYDWMRYTLGSSLLIGAYCAYDGGDNGHHQRWWYDEYDACGAGKGWLGYPLGPAYAANNPSVTLETALDGWTNRQMASTLWRRDYTNGIVLVNPGFEGDRISVAEAGGWGVWTDLTYANVVPGSVTVDNNASFATPWASAAYEIDNANGRIRFLQGGGISSVNEVQNILYQVQGGTGVTAQLGGSYRKLLGAQDREVNDGSVVTSVTVPATDGIVLMNPAYAESHVAILVDDQNPEFNLVGSGWTTRGWDNISYEITGGGNNRYGPTFRFLANTSGNASAGARARWTPNLPTAGLYRVSFYAPHETSLNGSQQASALRFVVQAADGTHAFPGIDHRNHPHEWEVLGDFPFEAGTGGWVELQADGAGGYLMADAVRLVRVGN